jgi:hypothetical protein
MNLFKKTERCFADLAMAPLIGLEQKERRRRRNEIKAFTTKA